ncbi:LOW QUALITY PROTEIN: conserved hypothetical protein, partial [Streptomyces sp. SPB78]
VLKERTLPSYSPSRAFLRAFSLRYFVFPTLPDPRGPDFLGAFRFPARPFGLSVSLSAFPTLSEVVSRISRPSPVLRAHSGAGLRSGGVPKRTGAGRPDANPGAPLPRTS